MTCGSIAVQVPILDTDPVSDPQVADAFQRHGLIAVVVESYPYAIGVLLLAIALFYLVAHHRAADHTGDCRDILPGTTADLMPTTPPTTPPITAPAPTPVPAIPLLLSALVTVISSITPFVLLA